MHVEMNKVAYVKVDLAMLDNINELVDTEAVGDRVTCVDCQIFFECAEESIILADLYTSLEKQLIDFLGDIIFYS